MRTKKQIKIRILLKRISVFALVSAWLLTGWPGIHELRIMNYELGFPPRIGEAHAAITYVGTAQMPASENGNSAATNAAITPPSMSTGDFVLVYVSAKTTGITITNSTTGGQTWTAGTDTEGSSMSFRSFYCFYNGTWSADPAWSWTNSVPYNIWMLVYRNVSSGSPIDAAESIAAFAAPTGSFDVTIAANTITTSTDGAYVVAMWTTSDNNTWALQTPWTNPDSIAYWRNSGGTDQSMSVAYTEQGTAGGNGAVTNRQTGVGGDAGIRSIIALKPAAITTVGNDSSEPSSVTIAPSASITDLDNFTLQTNYGNDTVTALTVTLGPANAYNNIAQVDITNTSNVAQCTAVTSLTSNTVTFPATTCSISVSSSLTTFKIRITPKTHANMPSPSSGASYATTGTVTAITCTNITSLGDSGSATITVDNLSPDGATSPSGAAGDNKVTLTWTSSANSGGDFDTTNGSVVLRWASGTAGSEVPAEGKSDYIATDSIAPSATVACVISSAASTILTKIDGAGGDTGCTTSNLTNGQQYTYKVFQRDTRGNYDVGVSIGTFTPSATPPTYTQNHYKWYVNPSPTIENVTDAWSSTAGIDLSEDTILTPIPFAYDPPSATQQLRLRVNITVNSNTIANNTKYFKMQFRTGTDTDCSAGSWTDVGAAGGAQAWVYTSDTTVADDAALSVAKLTGTDRLETYSRVIPANTPIGTSATGEDIEFDFHIVGGTAFTNATRYLFRLIETTSDGSGTTALTAWTNCPILHTEPGTDNLLRHGNFFSGESEQGFFWAD